MVRNKYVLVCLIAAAWSTSWMPIAQAAIVTPQMGGGQVGMMGAPMKHTDVMFDGTNITLHVDDTVATPWLRPLAAGDTFLDSNSVHPYDVLEGRAYNFQNAWNVGGLFTLPANSWIWVERLSQDAGLEVYQRAPSTPEYAPIFQNDGDRWRWTGTMTHNAYAVLDPLQSTYSANYRVYIGDGTTGVPLSGYGSADVTWTWNATPVPEPASLSLLAIGAMAILRRRR